MSQQDNFDRVSYNGLPSALRSLCESQEAQQHPWLLAYLKNLTQAVWSSREHAKLQETALDRVSQRLAVLERKMARG